MDIPLDCSNYSVVIKQFINKFQLDKIDEIKFLEKIAGGMASNMSREDMSKYCSETAASMYTEHPQYMKLAAIILTAYQHSITLNSFSEKMHLIQKKKNILNDEIYKIISENEDIYNQMIDYSRDYIIGYSGVVTLLRSYMITIDEIRVERAQDIYMRVAIQLHRTDFENVKLTYDLLSLHYYTHGTPTLYNSCFKRCQLASCFLVANKADSIEGLFSTLTDMAIISKFSGGLGLHMHNVRSNGSKLISAGGKSKGIVPVIKIINDSLKYINQGGARRVSTIAIYLEPWHKDIFQFLELRKNTGLEEHRAREVFQAMWVNDLFMQRVEENKDWSLFDPNDAVGLSDVYGEEFNNLYCYYENIIVDKIVVPAQSLWKAIISSQIETGVPYMLYKDSINRSSNQKNIGIIKSSNLCAEITEYSDPNETAVCNLASICLPKFVKSDKTFDFHKLKVVTGKIVENLNKAVDSTCYPLEITEKSNKKHRPIGIGVQGLADVFILMRYPFESEQARELNKLIFETMYFGCLEASCNLAKINGAYETFKGSPLSQGIFHFDMFCPGKNVTSGMWNWESLRNDIIQYGVRNSLSLACMPTASTSQICGNSECIEPITSNLYTRRTLAGEFQCVNTYLMNDLLELGLWNNEMRNLIIEKDGSIQNIPGIPIEIQNLYKTIWEIKMKVVIDYSADRQAFIDQSQSLNLYIPQPTYAQLTSMHFYGWKSGLKTGMYYLRTMPVASAIKFTVNQELIKGTLKSMKDEKSSKDEESQGYQGGVCESCSC